VAGRWTRLLALAAAVGCGGDGGEGGTPAAGAPAPKIDPFDEDVLATYELAMSTSDWDAMVADPFDNTWRPATLVWRGETYERVAVRPSGERSRIPGNPKPSLRLEFDELVPDREFHGFSTLKLDGLTHDQAMMRARLQYPAYAALGIPAPRYVHARLLVNGVYKGLYGVEERLGREFLRKRLGPPVGQLYEFTEGTSDLIWRGEEEWRYIPAMWIPKIDDLPADAAAIRNLVDILHHRPADLPAVFDVDAFARFMAAEVLTGEGDGYLSGPEADDAENLFMTVAPADGRFLVIPWDRDQGFYREQDDLAFGFGNMILTRRILLEDPVRKAAYRDALRALLADAWSTARMQARIDAVWAQIREAVAEDALKRWPDAEVADEVEWIKAYVARRNAAFAQQLEAP
jgi:spore coat protein CotH